jgi:CO/xanthine dehydrogenase Mo-binding subunit
MLSRRNLLGGGALVVAFALSPRALSQSGGQEGGGQQSGGGEGGGGGPKPVAPGLPGDLSKFPLLDSWIRVDAQGHVTVFTGKVELGQGIKTALIQLAAEELAIDPSGLTLVTADTARTPDEEVTAGSHSMQDSGTAILNAAANVRLLLTQAAAARWSLIPDQIALRTAAAHAPDGRSLGYGDLAAGLSLHVAAIADAPRQPAAAFRLIGKNWPRVDIPAKLTGGSAYVQDMRLPGMLHARVVRGPSNGTQLKAPNFAAAEKLPGVVKIVRNGRFAAVLAEQEWQAITALRQLNQAGWERAGAPIPAGDLFAALQGLPHKDNPIFDYPGPPSPPGARRLSARYTRPYLMHGSIGPSCAVALWRDGGVTVWTHTQGVNPLQRSLAQLLGVTVDKVRCIHVEGSGCYGHNGADDVAADAALAARAVPGRPVRMQWMREQEHGWEPLGPAMIAELQGELGPDGRIAGWRHAVWSNTHNGRPGSAGGLLAGAEVDPPFPPQTPKPIPMPEGGGDRNANPLYALPNASGVQHFIAYEPVRVSALRSLGAHMNIFAIESFMDELAQVAGVDPLTFRLNHMQDQRARAVMMLCADRFGWSRRPQGGSGRGCGFAFARYKNLGAYCALALEVEVDHETGRIGVRRAIVAVDSGEAVNPDGIRNQVEGAIVQSLSWSTQEAVGLDSGRRTSFDWSAYPILRFEDVPDAIEVHILDRPGQPFLGTGEAGQGPTGAAVANAVFDAVHVRVRDLPLSPERVKAAIGV